jgi:hypothetical protein
MTVSAYPQLIEDALVALPQHLRARSGKVFYTGTSAFHGTRPVYVLGLNPGQDVNAARHQTIGENIAKMRKQDVPWSDYVDEQWKGSEPGCQPMQLRVRWMLGVLGLDPRATPTSNVVFARTRSEAALVSERQALMDECWPVHQAVIDALSVRVLLCLGAAAGAWVRNRLDANTWVDDFRERYDARHWLSTAHRNSHGYVVITATHPSRADWKNSNADPTPMIRRVLERIGSPEPS